VEAWRRQNDSAAPVARTTLLDCGPHDATWRKWILDVDAPMDALSKQGFSPDPGLLLVGVLDLASRVADALHAAGYLPQPCPFAIVSRHTARKRSWHVTLCAYACHERWREALRCLTFDAALHPLAPFVDAATLNNSKSQYMQVWGSTKVAPGIAAPAESDAFVYEGVWASATQPVATESALLFAAATSLVLHDPWSVPFVGVGCTLDLTAGVVLDDTFVVVTVESKKAPSRPKRPRDTSSGHRGDWPDADAPWMRALLADADTRLSYIPSMDRQSNRPCAIERDADIDLHAYVYNMALCPHMLLLDGIRYQHPSNKSVVLASRSRRLFVRCFSERCKRPNQPRHPRVDERGWIELFEVDLAFAQRHRRLPPPSSTKPEEAPLDWPPALARIEWLHRLLPTLLLAPTPHGTPPRLGRGHVVLRARAQPTWCPFFLATKGRLVPSHAVVDVVVVVERSDRTAVRESHRLFARCPALECAHLALLLESTDGWAELDESLLI
jgi:hypothetical protein